MIIYHWTEHETHSIYLRVDWMCFMHQSLPERLWTRKSLIETQRGVMYDLLDSMGLITSDQIPAFTDVQVPLWEQLPYERNGGVVKSNISVQRLVQRIMVSNFIIFYLKWSDKHIHTCKHTNTHIGPSWPAQVGMLGVGFDSTTQELACLPFHPPNQTLSVIINSPLFFLSL